MTEQTKHKRTRTETRLSFGGFVGPDKTESQMLARQRFLDVLHDENPWVLDGLFRTAYPAYRAVCFTEKFGDAIAESKPDQSIRFIQSGGNGITESEWPAIEAALERGYQELAPLRTELLRWSDGWGIAEPWVLESACRTLARWRDIVPALPESIRPQELWWDAPGYLSTAAVTMFKVETVGWHLLSPWTFAEWSATFLEYAKERLAEYERDVLEQATNEGIAKAPTLRDILEHFRWLVWYQVFGMTATEIEKKVGTVSAKGVMSTVNRYAKLINLNLREPSKPGRPRNRAE